MSSSKYKPLKKGPLKNISPQFITQLIPKAIIIVHKPDSIHYPQV